MKILWSPPQACQDISDFLGFLIFFAENENSARAHSRDHSGSSEVMGRLIGRSLGLVGARWGSLGRVESL